MQDIARVVDTQGLNCPLPILRLQKSLKEIETGTVLKLIATDPGALKDVEAFCRQNGHQMLSSGQNSGIFEFLVKKR